MGPSTILDPPPAAPRATTPRDRVAAHLLATEIARSHGSALMRIARRFAGDPDDAHDAYQRALVLLLEHATTIDRAKALPWMKVVVRREAIALRRRHDRHLPFDVDAVDQRQASDRTDEHLARIDVATRAGEALATLKESEAQALCLRAQGLSYEEIGEAYGWSYTKVNRAVSEGRKAFVDHYLGTERGDTCDDAGARIGAYLAGELRARDHVRIRAHLTRCPACRSRLHAERSADRALQALLPPAMPVAAGHGWLHDHVLGPTGDLVARLLPASDQALGAKVGAVALSTVAVAGGGAAVHQATTRSHPSPLAVRPALTAGSTSASARRPAAPSTGAAALTGATTAGVRIVDEREQAAAEARRRASARRRAAARRAAQRSAAAREFAPAASEFVGSSPGGPAGASRAASSGSTAPAGGGTSTASAAAPAPVEVPTDASTSDAGIAVTTEP